MLWLSAQWKIFFKLSFFRVRQKQNKYPILFLTQGKSDIYPELMDLRSRTTPIAMSFAQFENLLVSYAWISNIYFLKNVLE